MIKYAKFNNSRSTKVPFYVYLKFENGSCKDVFGSGWAISSIDEVINKLGGLEITEAEYLEVEKSAIPTTLKIGMEVVVTDYVPSRLRYDKIVGFDETVDKHPILEKNGCLHKRIVRDSGILIHRK